MSIRLEDKFHEDIDISKLHYEYYTCEDMSVEDKHKTYKCCKDNTCCKDDLCFGYVLSLSFRKNKEAIGSCR